MIRAVLDPGVLISALISQVGAPAGLLEAWASGAFELVVSDRVLEELELVLRRPKFHRWVTEDDIAQFLETLRAHAVVEPDPEAIAAISPDPDDDYLIALAIAAGAHVLVSGDRHLTELTDLRPPVRTPRSFLDTLS